MIGRTSYYLTRYPFDWGWSAHDRALERAGRIEREWGLRGQRLYGVATKGAYLYLRGRLDESRACVEEIVKNQDVAPPRRIASATAALLSIAFGDDALWDSFDPATLREAREKLDDPDCVYILAAHAALLAARGSLAQAQADLRAAIGTLAFAPPEAMFALIYAARFLLSDELPRVSELAGAAAERGGEGARATEALVRAIVASRAGSVAETQSLASFAAGAYASLGWPMMQAYALELAGQSEIARTIYASCGAVAAARRLTPPALSATNGALNQLSAREVEVAAIVARGLRNSEIAKRLDIGSKTVEKHLASIFDKLGVRSRAQVVALIAQRTEDSSLR